MTPMDLADRLPSHVVSKATVLANGCWQWTGKISRKGYGTVSVNSRSRQTHRLFYLAVAEIPKGLQLDHLCRNRACCNPAHLEPVTPRENTLRSPIAIAACMASRDQCANGHPFNESNTVIRTYPDGRFYSRLCRICRRESSARARHRRSMATT